MARFQTKRSEIEARQFTSDTQGMAKLLADWIDGQIYERYCFGRHQCWVIELPESSDDEAVPGDWVVKHPNGRTEALNADQFRKLYEPAPDTSQHRLNVGATLNHPFGRIGEGAYKITLGVTDSSRSEPGVKLGHVTGSLVHPEETPGVARRVDLWLSLDANALAQLPEVQAAVEALQDAEPKDDQEDTGRPIYGPGEPSW